MDKKYKRRLITLLLSLALIITYMPTSFLAYAVDDNPAVTQEDTTGTGTDVGGGTGTDAGDGTGTDVGDGTGTDLGDGTGADQQPADTLEETGETDTPVVDEPLTTESSGNRDLAPGEVSSESDDGNITLRVRLETDDLRNVDGHWVKDVENVSPPEEFQYSIKLDINEEIYREYPAGAIKITIPAGILKHMNYKNSDPYIYDPTATRSLEDGTDSCSLAGSVKPQNQATDDDDWYYTRSYSNGRYWYTIINKKSMAEIDANSVEFEVIYNTVKPSYMYADFNLDDLTHCASDTLDVHLEATYSNGNKTQANASGPEVYLNTSAVIAKVNKDLNATWEAFGTDANGNETNYLYLQYKVEVRVDGTTPSSKPTQQYNLIFDDAFEGAFSNMMADWAMNGGLDGETDGEYELVGYYSSDSQDASKYTKNEDGTYVVKGTLDGINDVPKQEITRYVLVRVPKPEDALHLNYSLDNEIKVTVDPLGGGDSSTTMSDPESFRKAYDNTRPTGRFMIHKWSNSNYDSADHNRTDAYGVYTNYKKDWGHQNNELGQFKSGSAETLRELRYFTWYEGYSVRYTPYTTPHKLSYEFTDQDLSIEHHTDSAPISTGVLSQCHCKLTADDYFFSEIDFYPEAQNATYDEEAEMWHITRSGNPFEGDDPIVIEAKFGSYSSEWKEVAKATYSKSYSDPKSAATGTITASDSRVSVSFGTYEGEKYVYNTSGGSDETGFIIKFNTKDCVAYRIRHTNDHYYFMCNVKTTANLKRTSHILDYSNFKNNNYVYIANFADMSVFDETYVSETNTNGRVFNFNDNAGEHRVNRVAGAAAVTQNNLMRTHKYLMNGEKDDDNQLYKATWVINGAGLAYAGITNVGQEYPRTYEKLNKGTFYDMLPRGSEIYPDLDGIKVYKVLVGNYGESDISYIDPSSSSYNPAIDQKYLLSPDQYTVELIEGTYNQGGNNQHSLNGLTMLKVTINTPTVENPPEAGCVSGYTVVYDTVSYYEDLNRYGNTLLNATAFEAGNGTAYHEMGFPDDPRGHDLHKNKNNNWQGNSTFLMNIPTDHPDRDSVLDALTDLEPGNDVNLGRYWFDYDFAVTTVYYNEYNLSGISKRVRLAGETSWGIRREVEPRGDYQYRIRYATDSGTSVKDIILSDKIEGYVSEEDVSSEWFGTLNSISLELPRGSTVNPASFTYYISTNPDAVVDRNIDLTSSDWTTVEYGADLSNMNVKCVAVDTTGYTLPPSSSMSLILNMTAPTDNNSDKAWPTTYNDSHVKGYQLQGSSGSGEDGQVITNVSNQTQVIYTLGGKVMVEKVDEDGNPMVGVEFILEGDSSLYDQDGNRAHIYMTERTDYNGHAVFENVPLSGTGYYTLSENVPLGYVDEGTTWRVEILGDGSTQIDGQNKTGVYLKVVNKEGTVINVTKKWARASGYSHAPTGATVTLELYDDGQPTGETVVLDGKADTKQPGRAGYESASWKATFTGLPKYRKNIIGSKNEIEYTVVEIAGWTGFTVSYDTGEDYTTDGGVITNTEETIDIPAEKIWLDLDGSTTPPEDATATFRLVKYRDGVNYGTGFEVTLDGIVDPEPKGQGAYESEPWKATFKQMPKYETIDGQAQEIKYRIYEKDLWWENYRAETQYSDNGVITNKRWPATITVKKRWKYTGASTSSVNAPEGATVTLALYADGVDTGISYTLDGTPDEAPTGPGGYEINAWEVRFINIPMYRMVDDRRVQIQYTVVETAGWTGFSEPTAAAGNNGTLVNTEIPIEVTAEKEWADSEGNKLDPPAGAKVTFTLVADGVESTTKKVVLDGTVDAVNNKGYEYEAWKVKFPNLTKYKIVNGKAEEINYTVKETVTWPGYSPSSEDGVESGGVITNTPQTTELTVEKAWDPLNLSGNAPDNAKVTFTLVVDGVESTSKKVVLDGTADTEANDNGYESEAWKAKFPNLPKYRAVNGQAVEIQYTVKETGTWPGYKVTYEGGKTYAVDKGKITNSEEMVSLSVKKAWLNYDGSTNPPTDAEVTFTLYADGQPTEYSVTLKGEDVSEPIMQGGQETPEWTASFVRLPKYRVNDKDELVEIEYTVKETGTWPGYTVSYPGGEERTYAVDGETITNTQIDAKGSTPFEGTKNIEGRSFREYDEWTFTVTPLSGAPMNDANGNAIGSAASPYQYVLNKDSGITVGQTTATFTTPAIYFTLADVGKTYRYEITESGTVTGVTNDTTVYTVMVTIENNNDGTLKVTKKYTRPKKLTPGTIDPHLPGGRVIGGYVVDWLSDLVLGEHEVKPFDPGSGEIIPGNGGTIHPFDPGTPGGGIDEKLVEVTDDAEFTNVYTPPDLEITKKLDGYVDAGTESNVTLAFEVKGYVNGANGETLAYHNYVGMTFNKNDVDPVTGLYQKTVRLTGLPEFDRITVTEIYSGNYKPGQTGAVPAVYEEDKHLWTVTLDNSHNGYTPGSGVVNKYENGTYVQPGGNSGGGGEPSAGDEGN